MNHDITQLVLETALSLAHDGGVKNVTVDKITQISGVAKTTIYRRWPNAGAIVMDAFLSEIVYDFTYPPDAHIIDALKTILKNVNQLLKSKKGILFRNLLAEVQSNPELSQALWERWNKPRRDEAKAAMKRAVERGEITPDTDFDLVIDSIIGAMYYRILIPYNEIDDEFFDTLVMQVFKGIEP